MPIPSLADMTAFVAVAEHGNFTRAASHLELSLPTLGRKIRTIEDQLGVRLFNRTTRSVALTEIGENLLARLRPALAQYEAAVESINAFREKPAGFLRLLILPTAANLLLIPRLSRFLAEYPEIIVELCTDPTKTDIVAEHCDAGIRAGGGIEQDMIAVRISEESRWSVLASPDYLARHSRPETPEDLRSHNCIRLRYRGAVLPWRFDNNGATLEVAPEGNLILGTADLIIRAAAEGIGLAYMSLNLVDPLLEDGRLVPILSQYAIQADAYYLFYPSRRQVPASLQALIDFLKRDLAVSRVLS